jgi:HSP20 family molecular chaperone IbpA
MSKLNVTTVPSADDRSLSVFAEFDEIADRIRDRAFQLFAGRNFEDGHALEDWLAAEHQICWPAAEMVEEDDEYEIKVALAGFKPNEIDVTAAPREIIIKAAHESHKKEDDDAVTVFSEFVSNSALRRFELPSDIDTRHVEAEFKNGLLKIEAPKIVESKEKPRTIKVSAAA